MKVRFEMHAFRDRGETHNLYREMDLDYVVTPGLLVEPAHGHVTREVKTVILDSNGDLIARLRAMQLEYEEEAATLKDLAAAGWRKVP
jgi:hypothetical protein